MAIEQISSRAIGSLGKAAPGVPSPGASGQSGFGETLHNLVKSVDSTDAAANEAVADMLSGSGDVHTAMIALQNAEHTLQLTVAIRNKLVQAYQDVMRMPM